MGADPEIALGTGLEARRIGRRERARVTAFLSREPRANLYLLDLTNRVAGPTASGEVRPEVVGVWRGDTLVGVAAVRPSVVFDHGATDEVVAALLPALLTLGTGLAKSTASVVEVMWSHLSAGGRRRALIDRAETSYALRRNQMAHSPENEFVRARPATRSDLDALVIAARESLREENRPDPYASDIRAFRRWVRGRISRARVIEVDDQIVFAGYADVRRPEGWLLQGVYTWPGERRLGYGRAGVASLCREAFAAGADHVQLTVVEGNEAGHRLYRGLGFEPFGELRTILFC